MQQELIHEGGVESLCLKSGDSTSLVDDVERHNFITEVDNIAII